MISETQARYAEDSMETSVAIPLQALADALAARSALARSLPDDLATTDPMPFALVDAQVNAQLEAAAAQLAAQDRMLAVA